MKRRFSLSLLLFALAVPTAVRADHRLFPHINPFERGEAANLATREGLVTILTQVIEFLLLVTGGLAVFFILYGAVRYIAAAGNPDQLEKAKKTTVFAVVGLVVVLFSYTFVELLKQAAGL